MLWLTIASLSIIAMEAVTISTGFKNTFLKLDNHLLNLFKFSERIRTPHGASPGPRTKVNLGAKRPHGVLSQNVRANFAS